jgi:hypothetical protein
MDLSSEICVELKHILSYVIQFVLLFLLILLFSIKNERAVVLANITVVFVECALNHGLSLHYFRCNFVSNNVLLQAFWQAR